MLTYITWHLTEIISVENSVSVDKIASVDEGANVDKIVRVDTVAGDRVCSRSNGHKIVSVNTP